MSETAGTESSVVSDLGATPDLSVADPGGVTDAGGATDTGDSFDAVYDPAATALVVAADSSVVDAGIDAAWADWTGDTAAENLEAASSYLDAAATEIEQNGMTEYAESLLEDAQLYSDTAQDQLQTASDYSDSAASNLADAQTDLSLLDSGDYGTPDPASVETLSNDVSSLDSSYDTGSGDY